MLQRKIGQLKCSSYGSAGLLEHFFFCSSAISLNTSVTVSEKHPSSDRCTHRAVTFVSCVSLCPHIKDKLYVQCLIFSHPLSTSAPYVSGMTVLHQSGQILWEELRIKETRLQKVIL